MGKPEYEIGGSDPINPGSLSPISYEQDWFMLNRRRIGEEIQRKGKGESNYSDPFDYL